MVIKNKGHKECKKKEERKKHERVQSNVETIFIVFGDRLRTKKGKNDAVWCKISEVCSVYKAIHVKDNIFIQKYRTVKRHKKPGTGRRSEEMACYLRRHAALEDLNLVSRTHIIQFTIML